VAKRRPKQPVTAVKKGDDDWLSPLIGAAGTMVGAAIGGPVGAMIGGAIGSTVGKGAASAAGMEETGVTKALNTASTVGQGVADLAGVMPTGGAGAQPAAPQAPAVPAAAQPGVAMGQDMVAQRVAADGLAQSPMVRSPMAQQIYEAGAYVPPSMAVSQVPEGMVGRAQEGSLGFVPGQGTLYEASPEAANRRRQEALRAMVEARESQLMANQPFYAESRYAADAAAQQAAAEAELSEYRRRFGVLEGEMAADKAIEERVRRAQNVSFPNALANPEFPVYRLKR
jgi:hypothetical protein